MRYLYTLLFFAFIYTPVSSQHSSCLANGPSVNARLIQNLKNTVTAPRDDEFIPIVFHIINRDEEIGNVIAYGDIYDAVCLTNSFFAGSGMQFYVLDIKADIYNVDAQETPLEHLSFLNEHRHPQALNVFITQYSSLPLMSFMAPTEDLIVIDESVLDGEHYLLAHQIGHFFSLLHTFHNWGSEDFGGPMLFDPTGQFPASDTTHLGVEAELVDGSNCTYTGDMICDTPPDYAFGGYFYQCEYDVVVLDANSDTIPWQPGNIMGSFTTCPIGDYYFSEEQKAIMFTDFLNEERAYLRQLPQPTVNTSALVIDSLGYDEFKDYIVYDGYCALYLDWTDLGPGVNYIIEISEYPTFLFPEIYSNFYFSTEPNLIVSLRDLRQEGINYYWRVKPIGTGCQTTSFTEADEPILVYFCDLAVKDFQLNIEWNISPNPIQENQEWAVSIIAEQNQYFQFSVLSPDGKMIHEESLQTGVGENIFRPSLPALPSGIYMVRLSDGRKVNTKKLVIF